MRYQQELIDSKETKTNEFRVKEKTTVKNKFDLTFWKIIEQFKPCFIKSHKKKMAGGTSFN